MERYDLALSDEVWDVIEILLTVLGGAGSMDHLRELIERFRFIGAGAGNLFVFKSKYGAV